ncbi:MAG: DNA/RNA non-specific endonuclease [Cytophagales bacterium]|nr:DNA/RNA non-specific endonuclease [Cytophagales bacterium]
MARSKSSSSNGFFWAVVLVGVFLLVGNWEKITGWFGKKDQKKTESTVARPTDSKPLPKEEEKDETETDATNLVSSLYPTGAKVEVVQHAAYTLGYAEPYEQAAWVAYRLTAKMVNGKIPRDDNFRPDPDVSTGSAVPEDYRRSGYDRGHLAPAADFRSSAKWMDESFFMSNMSPQIHEFNAGIWENLESQTRRWARRFKTLYVITGPVLRDGLPRIGKYNQVAVPEYFYKVIYLPAPENKAIGFVMRNEGSDKKVRDFAMPVAQVEKLTGLRFFTGLPSSQQTVLKAEPDLLFWFAKQKK